MILLATEGLSTQIVYNYLAARFEIEAVILEQPLPRKQQLRFRAKKLGYFTAFGQVLFQVLCVPVLRWAAKRRTQALLQLPELNPAPIPESKIRRVTSANAPETIELLRGLSPKLVMVNGTRILSKKLLGALSVPFVNVHAGITPAYRGVHGGYWALAQNDRARCGVTVHLIDAGVDTGAVLRQAQIQPTAADNFTTYPLLQQQAALPLLAESLRELLEAQPLTHQTLSTATDSQQWFHPTIWGYLYRRVVRGIR